MRENSSDRSAASRRRYDNRLFDFFLAGRKKKVSWCGGCLMNSQYWIRRCANLNRPSAAPTSGFPLGFVRVGHRNNSSRFNWKPRGVRCAIAGNLRSPPIGRFQGRARNDQIRKTCVALVSRVDDLCGLAIGAQPRRLINGSPRASTRWKEKMPRCVRASNVSKRPKQPRLRTVNRSARCRYRERPWPPTTSSSPAAPGTTL